MRYTSLMGRDFKRIREMNRTEPACFDAVHHGAAYLGVFNAYRGTESPSCPAAPCLLC
jgi:hypothetical protein